MKVILIAIRYEILCYKMYLHVIYFQLKAKKEQTHASQQRAQSRRQLEEARRANTERMVGYPSRP